MLFDLRSNFERFHQEVSTNLRKTPLSAGKRSVQTTEPRICAFSFASSSFDVKASVGYTHMRQTTWNSHLTLLPRLSAQSNHLTSRDLSNFIAKIRALLVT